MWNTVKRVSPWQLNFEKNCTDCRHAEKYKIPGFITVTLLKLKTAKINVKKFSV